MVIEQYNLDIEQWLSSSVESLLSTEQRFRLSQLVDYDVQLVEVFYKAIMYCVLSNVLIQVDSDGIAIAAIVPLMAVLDQQLGRYMLFIIILASGNFEVGSIFQLNCEFLNCTMVR